MMMMMARTKNTQDIEAPPGGSLSPCRPRLDRSDAVHQPSSPLVIAAYCVLASSDDDDDGVARLEEVSLKEALDGGCGCDDFKTLEEVAATEEQQREHQQALSSSLPKQYWIDVEIMKQHHSDDHLESSAFFEVKETILDKLLCDDNYSCRLLRRHLQKGNELQTPQVLILRHAALLVVRVLGEGDMFGVRHAAAVCLPRVVVTVTSSSSVETASNCSVGGTSSSNSSVSNRLRRMNLTIAPHQDTLEYILEHELHDASVLGCILMWLEFHLNRTKVKAHRLRQKLFQLQERASCDPANVSYAEIASCRDELLKLSSVAEEQNECMEAMEQGEKKSLVFSNDAMQGSMNVLKQSAGATERLIMRLQKRVDDLKQGYDAYQQSRINHRLNVLTIFSAVFLPLTLMAGIYGMNFINMPELQTQYGYYWLLGSMACVASVFLFFFYIRGWLS